MEPVLIAYDTVFYAIIRLIINEIIFGTHSFISVLSRRRSAAGAVLSGHRFPSHVCLLPTLTDDNVNSE